MRNNSKSFFVRIVFSFLLINLFSSNILLADQRNYIGQKSYGKLLATYSVISKSSNELLDWVDQDTIVIVNIEDTIFMPKDAMFSYGSPYRNFINNLVNLGYRNKDYLKAVLNWYNQRQVKLIDNDWPDFINKMQEKGALVYGIMKMPLHLVKIEKKILSQVGNLGISFSPNINSKSELIIRKKRNWFSKFYNGLILTGPYGKSNTVMDFLNIAKIKSKKIVIIDNDKGYLTDINSKFQRLKISYRSLWYLGVTKITFDVNPEIVTLKQNYLIEKGKWLQDDEAAKILDSKRKI